MENQQGTENVQALLDTWQFPWSVIDVLIGGKSSIDLQELYVRSRDDATDFIRNYGYNCESSPDLQKIDSVRLEAIHFIESYLITDRDRRRGVSIPDFIVDSDDIRDLMLWASDASRDQRMRRMWSCAVLRVVHTIAHLDGVNRYSRVDIAREQIMARFRSYIFRTEDGSLRFGTPKRNIAIEKVEWKHVKARQSIILKLLHKPNNVAETIYDLLGIRVITTRLCDVMLAVKFLREFHMINFANCVPSRSGNNLVDKERFRAHVEALRELLASGAITAREFESNMNKMTRQQDLGIRSNPHSSRTYRSIHLTCRQMIRTRNPHLLWLDKMREELDDECISERDKELIDDLAQLVEGWHNVRDASEFMAFFPFEIQILDGEAYAKVLGGDASHDRYKRAQVRTVRRRVLGEILDRHA